MAESGASPFRAEILDNRIGYVRLGAISPANVGELDAALQKFTTSNLPALILDLRATPAGSDFEQTAEICRRFSPKGKVLFSVKKPNIKQEQILTSKEDPKFHGILVAVVDRATAGNPEVIAAVLRTHANAMIIGQQTCGEAAEFAVFPLSNGRALRIAVAEVSLPDSVPVFPGGVKPDLAVDVPAETTEQVLKLELEKGVSEFVFERERPRLNEAALVAGTNPELDAAQLAQKSKGEKAPTPSRDVVLQRAVDFITTIAIYERKSDERKPAKVKARPGFTRTALKICCGNRLRSAALGPTGRRDPRGRSHRHHHHRHRDSRHPRRHLLRHHRRRHHHDLLPLHLHHDSPHLLRHPADGLRAGALHSRSTCARRKACREIA